MVVVMTGLRMGLFVSIRLFVISCHPGCGLLQKTDRSARTDNGSATLATTLVIAVRSKKSFCKQCADVVSLDELRLSLAENNIKVTAGRIGPLLYMLSDGRYFSYQ